MRTDEHEKVARKNINYIVTLCISLTKKKIEKN